jgi:hypothetical protein
MKKCIYIIVMFVFCQILMAQQDSILKAQKLYSEKEYGAALIKINEVISNGKPADLESAYILQTFILKDYAKVLSPSQSYIYRTLALEALDKLKALKTKSDLKPMAKYLSQTFNNDAALSLGKNEIEAAEKQFENYKRAANYCLTPTEIKTRVIDFKSAVATAYYNQFMNVKVKSDTDFKKAEDAYKDVLKIDPENISANYSLGVLYYNLAVDIVSNVNPDETDIEKINEMQDKMNPLFKRSQPYLEKASNLAPARQDVLQGLKYVYYNLNDTEKLKKVETKLKKLGAK